MQGGNFEPTRDTIQEALKVSSIALQRLVNLLLNELTLNQYTIIPKYYSHLLNTYIC